MSSITLLELSELLNVGEEKKEHGFNIFGTWSFAPFCSLFLAR